MLAAKHYYVFPGQPGWLGDNKRELCRCGLDGQQRHKERICTRLRNEGSDGKHPGQRKALARLGERDAELYKFRESEYLAG